MSALLTVPQAAYLAGLIDGEGSLECQKQIQKRGKTPRYVLRLSFVFATAEPLATIVQWFGGQSRIYPSTDPRRQDRHRIGITKNIAVRLIEECLPFLILKRRQAELILEIEAVRSANSPDRREFRQCSKPMCQTAVDQMEVLFQELRSLKSNKRPK